MAALGGLATNVLLVAFRGPELLGLFGFAYAMIAVVSHLASFGVQNSCLRQASLLPREANGSMLIAALLVSCSTSILTGSAMLTLWPLFQDSIQVDLGDRFPCLVAALVLFSINKIYLATLNGMRRIRLLYSLQLLRVALILTYVVWVCLSRLENQRVVESFLFSEVILFVLLSCVLFKDPCEINVRHIIRWVRHHLGFGARSFITGLSIEAHTRLDLLVLAFFVSERSLGIYSFVSYFSEGLLQIIALVRNNVNPLLAKYFYDRNSVALSNTISLTRRWCLLSFSLLAGTVIALYLPAMDLLELESMKEGWTVLIILAGTLIVLSPLMPFDTILTQFGKPGASSLIFSTAAIFSLILNIIAIPLLGLPGAALATSVSWCLLIGAVVFATRKLTGYDLIRTSYRES